MQKWEALLPYKTIHITAFHKLVLLGETLQACQEYLERASLGIIDGIAKQAC